MIPFVPLKNKTILITGASRGIGYETAKQLAQFNVNIVLGSRTEIEALNDVEAKVIYLPLDVSDEDSVQQFFEDAEKICGSIDILINCAGVGSFENIIDSSTEDFDQMISVNLRGTYLTCKYAGKKMISQGKGHVLNLISIAGTAVLPSSGGYSASKNGALALSRVLHAELRERGIHVTSILPGAVSSSFWNDINPKPDLSKMIPTDQLVQQIIYLLHQPPGAVVDEITIMPPLGIL